MCNSVRPFAGTVKGSDRPLLALDTTPFAAVDEVNSRTRDFCGAAFATGNAIQKSEPRVPVVVGAVPLTVVSDVAVSLAELGSGVLVDCTWNETPKLPGAVGVATAVTRTEDPAGILPSEQVKNLEFRVSLHDPLLVRS